MSTIIDFKDKLILAPMAGYSDIAFRELCLMCGADMTVTEMVSAKALLYGSEKTQDLMQTSPLEKVKCVQLFGHEPEVFAQVVSSPLLQKFDCIDINMGCPAPKIFNNGDGSALLKSPSLMAKIVEACKQNTQKPITVKIRLGIDENNINVVQNAKLLEEAGASAICVHARTTKQGYSGKADWEYIKKVKEAVSVPVIANGDIVSKQSFEECKNLTGADAFMIGRAAQGNPFLFSQIKGIKEPLNKLEAIKFHYNKLLELYNAKWVVLEMRKHLAQYLKNVPADKALKQSLLTKTDVVEIFSTLDLIFKEGEKC